MKIKKNIIIHDDKIIPSLIAKIFFILLICKYLYNTNKSLDKSCIKTTYAFIQLEENIPVLKS